MLPLVGASMDIFPIFGIGAKVFPLRIYKIYTQEVLTQDPFQQIFLLTSENQVPIIYLYNGI
jgi:hypothetical protein